MTKTLSRIRNKPDVPVARHCYRDMRAGGVNLWSSFVLFPGYIGKNEDEASNAPSSFSIIIEIDVRRY